MQIVDHLIHWIEIHPEYGLFLSFFMAFAESLIVVGGLIPGSLAITGIGILAGSGVLDIYSTFCFAILGAIIGDTSSFFIGRYFKENLENFSIFKKYPSTLRVGKHYFDLHGGKSVFLGRFIGPIRAVVPAIAGMMNMPVKYFLIANISSAIGWSALFFFPGVIVGKGHEHIKSHISQFIICLIVLLSPLLIVKILEKIKLTIFKKYGLKIIKRFRHLDKMPLHQLVPKHSLHPYFKTLTELSYLFLIIVFGFISIILSDTILQSLNCMLPLWNKHQNTIAAFFSNASFLNDHIHLVLLSCSFIIFIIFSKNYKLFSSILVLIGFGLCLDMSLNVYNHLLGQTMSFTINPFIFSIAIQYLWFRILIQYRTKILFIIILFIVTAWNIDTLYLSLHDQLPWLEYVFAGLLTGQLAWLFCRLNKVELKYPNLWLLLIIFEMTVQYIISTFK